MRNTRDLQPNLAPWGLRALMLLIPICVLLAGCGGGGGGPGNVPTVSLGGPGTANTTANSENGTTSQAATYVGTTVCAECHTNFPYSNGYGAGQPTDNNPASPTYFDPAASTSVYYNYIQSVHFTPAGTSVEDYVTCEGCHGPGSQHYGVGPIPFYAPGIAQCEACHSGSGAAISTLAVVNNTSFTATGHANTAAQPDPFFDQGGSGTTQATYFGQLEWADANASIPVTKNQAIQECSVCHSPDTEATHIAEGDVPNPPAVTCANCHDPHNPADITRNYVPTRTQHDAMVDPSQNFNLKPVQVNNTPLGYQFGASNPNSGTWIRPHVSLAYHVGGAPGASFVGYSNQTAVGDPLRLTPERLCASCHTRGTPEFGVRAGANLIGATHNNDVFTQYINSGHADKNDTPFQDFSLLGTDAGLRPQWPYDMGGVPGQNGTTVPIDGRINGGANNYTCYQCHNGIGSIDYQNGVQGGNAFGDSADAHIIWGDATVTCITCHDPHQNGVATTQNVRQPVYNSYNVEFTPANSPTGTGNVRGGVANLFMDLTPIPSVGNDIICLFCHQGRESGWTAWNKVRRSRLGLGDSASNAASFWYNAPNTTINATSGFGFVDDHYLAAGPLTYGRNSTEFLGQGYSNGIPAHVAQGCVGCHMANPTDDSSTAGHTFLPNITTCQECHGSVQSFQSVPATLDFNGNGVVETTAAEIGSLTVIPAASAGGPGHTNPIYASGQGGSGLLGLLNEAIWDAGIEYDPTTYPYCFRANQAHTSANAFTAFTPNTLAACQNLNQLYNSGAPGLQGAIFHDPFYAAQILIDSLNVLGHTKGTVTTFSRPVSAPGGTVHSGRDYRTLSVP